jgi:flagellar biosynthesis chaperone FliJ
MNAPLPPDTEGADNPDPAVASGFVLSGEPPVLDVPLDETANPGSAHEAESDHAQASAAPAAPSLVIDTSALDHVARVALDSADLANRGAQAAASASHDLREAQVAMERQQVTARKHTLIALVVTCTVMLVCMTLFLIIGVRMNSRINQLDHTLDIVVKRVADINTGAESLESIRTSVSALSTEVEKLAQASVAVSTRLEETVKQTESLTTQIPSKTALQVASSAQNMARQVEALGSRMQSQASAVQTLSREVQTLRASVGNVERLNRDVQALITLQRERYLEALQKVPSAPPASPAAAASPTPPPVAAAATPGAVPAAPAAERLPQYPRMPGATSPNALPQGSSGVISVQPRQQP